ncbi:peroxisomal catalase A [Trichomonascus vanleenenianus]|uniref:catalase n=1 Tax=Trichomonascus vanleenenianus TaxID=2268995 RepID=UPI003ECB90F3
MVSDKKVPVYTTANGCPVASPYASEQVGKPGPLLLQDHHLIDLLSHFDRERIPERVVHAKGSGAYGYFEVTDDVSDICCADFLSKIGKRTKTFTRFSTVGGEMGSADAARDPRGFSTKFYTEEGNLDWVYNNTPIFFIRNPSKFPLFIHTQKRNPETNLKDANMFWDYLTANQECAHQIMHLFSDRGTPASYRHMNGYSGHTYKWVNAKGEFVYVQIHLISDQGIKNLTNEEAGKLSAENPDHAQEDLFSAIKEGNAPSWTVYVQTMTAEQAEKQPFSVFDLTKVWPHKEFPLRRFGKLVLNENPKNYFAEVEQAAFSPSHTVPGIEPSADPVLQSRLFSYPDTQRYRLGVNYQQIPVNCPYHAFNPFQRNGTMAINNYGNLPNYPSTSEPINYKVDIKTSEGHEKWAAEAARFHWPANEAAGDYKQAGALWKVLGRQPGQQENFVHNVSVHLQAARPDIQDRTFSLFSKIDIELGKRIRDATLKLSPRSAPRL